MFKNAIIGLCVVVAVAAAGFGGYEYKANQDTKAMSATPSQITDSEESTTISSFSGDVVLKDFTISGMNGLNNHQTIGILKNTSSETKRPCEVVIDFMDSKGSVTGEQIAMFLNPLAPGQQETFKAGTVSNIQASTSALITVKYN